MTGFNLYRKLIFLTFSIAGLAMNMRALKGEEMTGTEAEACAYLYTAALTNPMDHD